MVQSLPPNNVRNDPNDTCTIRQLMSLALAHLHSAALCTFVDLDLAARLSPTALWTSLSCNSPTAQNSTTPWICLDQPHVIVHAKGC
jgi:hypothetical protein